MREAGEEETAPAVRMVQVVEWQEEVEQEVVLQQVRGEVVSALVQIRKESEVQPLRLPLPASSSPSFLLLKLLDSWTC